MADLITVKGISDAKADKLLTVAMRIIPMGRTGNTGNAPSPSVLIIIKSLLRLHDGD